MEVDGAGAPIYGSILTTRLVAASFSRAYQANSRLAAPSQRAADFADFGACRPIYQ